MKTPATARVSAAVDALSATREIGKPSGRRPFIPGRRPWIGGEWGKHALLAGAVDAAQRAVSDLTVLLGAV